MNHPGLIFIATRVPWPVATGHYLRTYHVLKGLAENYYVHFFGFHEPTVSDAGVQEARDALGVFCASVHTRKLRTEQHLLSAAGALLSATIAGKPAVAAKYLDDQLKGELERLAGDESIVAVHGDSLPSVEYLRNVAVPVSFTNHNVEWTRLQTLSAAATNPVTRLFLAWQARLTRRYERRALCEFGDCVVVSEADRAELQKLYQQAALHVVPNGADVSQPPMPESTESPATALWVGGMNDPYNRLAVVFFAREVLPLIREEMADFRWRVVGKSPPADLLALASQPDSGIELAGFVDDVRDEYARASVVVVPLTAGGGTKLKTLEAMSMGRAIVTTSIGAEGIRVVPGKHVVIADDPREFAAAVVKLLRDPARRRSLASAARTLVEDSYDWRAVQRLMAEAIESSIARQRQDPHSCAA